MPRSILLAAAALIGAPALAQTPPAHRVTFVEAPPQGRQVVRDVLWQCAGASCTGGRSNSRPAIVCQALVRQLGAVSAFDAAGRPFDTAQIERCNASMRR